MFSFKEKIGQWTQTALEAARTVKSTLHAAKKTIEPLIPSLVRGATSFTSRALKGFGSTIANVYKGGTHYLSLTNINTLRTEQTEQAKDLRRVFKSSLKTNLKGFAIAFVYEKVFKFVLLNSILRIPGLKMVYEFTIEPLFELPRRLYFAFNNIIYAKVIHQAVVKSNLMHQESLLDSPERLASFPPLRELRSVSFYLVGILLSKLLYWLDSPLAFLVEAYFLGHSLVDYKLSQASISIEAGYEISAVNNTHYLGVGLSYRAIVELEKFLMQRYLNMPALYFDGPLSQIFIFLVHARDLPLQDPLKDYQCYVVHNLPTTASSPRNGLFLTPTNGASAVKKQFAEAKEEAGFVLCENLDLAHTNVEEEFVAIDGNFFKVLVANKGKWAPDLQGNQVIECSAENFSGGIQDFYWGTPDSQLSSPRRIPKTFGNHTTINETIQQHFTRTGQLIFPASPRKFYITYPIQLLADWLLKNSVKAFILELKHNKTQAKEKKTQEPPSLETSEPTPSQVDLFTIVSEKVELIRSWPITTQGLQLLQQMESTSLLIEFFKDDFKTLVKSVRQYRDLINLATKTIRRAGDLTANVEGITDTLIYSFDQIKSTLTTVSSPVLSDGALSNTLLPILKKFTDLSSYLKIPRWALIRIFITFLPAASIVESFQNISNKFGEFFNLPPEVALKILIDCIKLFHKYKVADFLDKILADEKYGKLTKLLGIEENISSPTSGFISSSLQFAFVDYISSLEEKISIQTGHAITLSQDACNAVYSLLKDFGVIKLTQDLTKDPSIQKLIQHIYGFIPALAIEQLTNIIVDVTTGIYQYAERAWVSPLANGVNVVAGYFGSGHSSHETTASTPPSVAQFLNNRQTLIACPETKVVPTLDLIKGLTGGALPKAEETQSTLQQQQLAEIIAEFDNCGVPFELPSTPSPLSPPPSSLTQFLQHRQSSTAKAADTIWHTSAEIKKGEAAIEAEALKGVITSKTGIRHRNNTVQVH